MHYDYERLLQYMPSCPHSLLFEPQTAQTLKKKKKILTKMKYLRIFLRYISRMHFNSLGIS